MSSAKPVALVTGASAGIGAELAKVFAGNGHDLVLVARSEDKLRALGDALASQYGARCTVLAQDLTAPDAAGRLFDEVSRQGLRVDVLVNNAGVLHAGSFVRTALAQHLELL